MELKEVKYWIDKDESNVAIAENEAIHQKQLDKLSSNDKILNWLGGSKTFWRSRTLDKLELFMGEEIFGEVMEMGAGTAWCSALLSKKKNVSQVYAMDFESFSAELMMPKIFDALGADQAKIQRVVGLYDDVKLDDNSLDFIFGMGALHHSQNLKTTFDQMYRVLKPGGKVLISEPTYTNSMSLSQEYIWREGIKPNGTKNKENGDQQFRVCQWESNALESGFDVHSFLFDNLGIWGRLKSYLFGNSYIKNRKTYNKFNKIVLYPFFGKLSQRLKTGGIAEMFICPDHDKLMMILEKPINHSYKAMSENVYEKY